jgi:hypothetical protein
MDILATVVLCPERNEMTLPEGKKAKTRGKEKKEKEENSRAENIAEEKKKRKKGKN